MSNNVNVLVVSGRLGKDPEMSYSNAGVAYTRFSIAVNYFDKNVKAFWLNCVIFGHTAEFLNKYAVKGDSVTVSGELRVTKYNNEQTKQSLTKVECICSNVELHSTRKKEETEEPQENITVSTPEEPF